jgi:hypothetical protein
MTRFAKKSFELSPATFNNISVISWWSVLLVEETEYSEKTTDLPIQNVIKRTASISYIANYPCISKTTYRSSQERLGLRLWCWTPLATLFLDFKVNFSLLRRKIKYLVSRVIFSMCIIDCCLTSIDHYFSCIYSKNRFTIHV